MEECVICNKKKHDIFAHYCDEHDVCIECGRKRKDLEVDNYAWGTSQGAFLCNYCNGRLKKEAIEKYNSPDDQEEYGDEPKCPCCGYVYQVDCESGLYEDGDTVLNCAECGSDFDCNTYVSFSYTCTKIKD
jgi:hypothetical protein